jgi:hypothetical protein
MGIYSNGYLIWGIPIEVEAGLEDDSPHMNYDAEDYADWKELPGDLVYTPYGHYDDSEYHRAILSTSKIKNFSGDCWTPTAVGKWDFNVEDYQPDDVDEFIDAVVALDETLLGTQGWYLVASVG